MKIQSLDFFRSLKKRIMRLKAYISVHHNEDKAEKQENELKLNGYTLVDPVPGGRKLNMMTVGHHKLTQTRSTDGQGKSRWLVNSREQSYKPHQPKPDPQIEYIYEELGLAHNLEPSLLTPPKQIN